MPISSHSLTVGRWPGGIVDWHLDENDFPEVPAAQLTTARLAADGTTWLDFAACLNRALTGGSAFTDLETEPDPPIPGFNAARNAACTEIREILTAQAIWESRTGIRFVPHRPTEEGFTSNWLTFRVGSGLYGSACSYNVHRWYTASYHSVLGYQDGGVANNIIRLERAPSDYCSVGTYVHELGHALGLWHTQGRQDRDAFVRMGPGSLAAGCFDCFNNRIPDDFVDVGPFDFRSIMLYSSYETNGSSTHESGPDCATVPVGDPCGTVSFSPAAGANPAAVTFVMPDVFNMMPFQPAHFSRASFRPTVEPMEGGACFPASMLFPAEERVRRSPPGGPPWLVTELGTTGLPSMTVPLDQLFADEAAAAAHPAIDDYECYHVVRTGPDASAPHKSRLRLPLVDPNVTYSGNAVLTPTDVSAVFHAYYPERIHPGSEWGEAGDRFGAAIASGDFDKDGVQDLAIAAPGAEVVFVFKGGYGSDDTGRIIHRPWLALDASGATALAVGDFDGDGVDDLAVGRGEATPRGAVRVFSRLGARGYLSNVTDITALGVAGVAAPAGWPTSSTAIDNDGFGASLAVANFSGMGTDDLAIGCPGCRPVNYDPVHHEPAGAPEGWTGATERTGAVFVLRGAAKSPSGAPPAGPVLVALDPVLDPFSDPSVRGSHVGSEFGRAVTFGQHPTSGGPQLFVGAPGGLRLEVGAFETRTLSYLNVGNVRVGNVYGFRSVGFGTSTTYAFQSVTTQDEQDSKYGFALDSPIGDDWVLLRGVLLVGAPTADVPHSSGPVPAGAVFGLPVPTVAGALGLATVRLDGRAIDTAFEDCVIAPDDGFGASIAHGLTLGQTFAPTDRVPNLAIGSPRRFVGCSNLHAPSRGAVAMWNLPNLRDAILAPHAPELPSHYLPNPDPAPTGPTGFGADICFLRPSTWHFRDLADTPDELSTATLFSDGQVGLVLGSELGVDTRGGLSGLPTGIARPIEPRAAGTTTVRPAIFQGW